MKLILIPNMIRLVNPNNDSTPGIPITIQTPVKDSETPSTKSIPDFTIGLITPTKKNIGNAETNSLEKQIDLLCEKIEAESFKRNILQNLRNNVKEIFDSEFTTFKSKCEEKAETS